MVKKDKLGKKIDKNKATLTVAASDMNLDVIRYLLLTSVINNSDSLDSFEVNNIETDNITFSEFSDLVNINITVNNYRGFLLLKESDLLDELPLDFPNRLKPVMVQQMVTKYRVVTDGEGNPIIEDVEDYYETVKTNSEGVSYMERFVVDDQTGETSRIEELFTNIPPSERYLWNTVFETKVRMVRREKTESYQELGWIEDPDGGTEPKTWSDFNSIIYEDKGSNKNCLVPLFSTSIPSSVFINLNSNSKYSVLSKTEALSLAATWSSL